MTVRDGERGQALVEFALILPVLLLLLVGLFDLSRAVFVSSTLATASREGNRYAIVHGAQSSAPSGPGSTTFTAPDVDSAVDAIVRRHAIGVASLTISSEWPDGTNARGKRVIVTARAPFTPVLSEFFLGGGLRLTLSGGSVGTIQR